ncbi:class I SAM-dependent methyltransferase [Streptomyces sp. NPDC048603]|uniref:class I SAM-dependent methyltransferase n=1 Tax=Streptomyces sp. NPDC048603 TaxID=3365577 RepID=UPI00372165D2
MSQVVMGMPEVMRADPANAEQARAWDGDEGAYWAEHADVFDRALRAYRDAFFEAAEIGLGETVLDIGCGTGETARDAARIATDGRVVGIDLSAAMLREARRRAVAEGLDNVVFEQADAQIHPMPREAFDVAISRTGTMFFADVVAAFRNIAAALRPGGRFVQLVWQEPARNEWFSDFREAMAAGRTMPTPPPGAPGPFALADPDRIRAVLAGSGFTDVVIRGQGAPMWFGAEADAAHRFVSGLLGWMLEDLDDEGRAGALRALRDSLTRHEQPDGVFYASATWLVKAVREA